MLLHQNANINRLHQNANIIVYNVIVQSSSELLLLSKSCNMVMGLEQTVRTGVAVESDAFACKQNYQRIKPNINTIITYFSVRMRSTDVASTGADTRSGGRDSCVNTRNDCTRSICADMRSGCTSSIYVDMRNSGTRYADT